jgi:hypothetical protein
MAPLFGLVSVAAFYRADQWRMRDVVKAFVTTVALLLPLVVWYARFPDTYRDTFGRWVLHQAHLRNPLGWMQALTNSGRASNVAALFWDFFKPSHLFVAPEARGVCGMYPSLFLVPIVVSVASLVRTSESETGPAERMRLVLISGCLIGPLAAAMFGEARADGRALILVPFSIAAAVSGATVTWRRGGLAARSILIATSIGGALQALYCLL